MFRSLRSHGGCLLGASVLVVLLFQLFLVWKLPPTSNQDRFPIYSFPVWKPLDQQHPQALSSSSSSSLSIQTIKRDSIPFHQKEAPAEPSIEWNGYTLHPIHDARPISTVHCIGDNFLPNAWMYRSCQYRNLCWQTMTGTFVVYPSSRQLEFQASWRERWNSKYAHTSSMSQWVSPIGTTPWWARKKRYQWKVNMTTFTKRFYYPLHDDVIWIPMAVSRSSDMDIFFVLTEILLPLYNLLAMFGWEDQERQRPMLVTIVNPEECNAECVDSLKLLLPLIGGTLEEETWKRQKLQPNDGGLVICASHAATGMGLLTARGLTRGGHATKDYATSHNIGRGLLLYEFAQRIVRNLGAKQSTGQRSSSKYIVTIMTPPHDPEFLALGEKLSGFFARHPDHDVEIQGMTYDGNASISIEKLKTYVRTAAIGTDFLITLAGDGAWPAMFLSRHSNVVLIYDEAAKVKGGGHQRIMENFDFWNHASYLKVHWMSRQGLLIDEQTVDVLKALIQEEAEAWKQQRPQETSQSMANREGSIAGTFNGVPIRLVELETQVQQKHHSRAHCVGENWEWDSANYRSCHIRHLCVDASKRPTPFLIANSPFSRLLNSTNRRKQHPFDLISSALDTHVMMGQSIRLGNGEPWFPSLSDSIPDSFYELDPNVVWMPYFAEQPNANNPGHLLWDYFLPIYNLVTMFGLEDGRMLINNIDMWCAKNAPYPCFNVTSKFLPLMGVADPSISFTNAYNPRLQLRQGGAPKSQFVCARHAAIGIGMLTDHGFKKHGQLIDDYRIVRNVGRGPMLWKFRNFMLRNLQMEEPTSFVRPYIITISIHSSNNPARNRDFDKQLKILRESFASSDVLVRTVEMGRLSLLEQLTIVKESAIFMSVIGGAASTAMFLERHGSLILYFDDSTDLVKGGDDPDMPNRMDWDFWNHASFLRVHWLPLRTMDEDGDLGVLLRLVRNELDSFARLLDPNKRHENFY